MQVNVTNDIRPPSKLLLALEGSRASLEYYATLAALPIYVPRRPATATPS